MPNGAIGSVDGKRHKAMPKTMFGVYVVNTPGMWFQQDGAAAYSANQAMELLRTMFELRILSRNSEILWSLGVQIYSCGDV